VSFVGVLLLFVGFASIIYSVVFVIPPPQC